MVDVPKQPDVVFIFWAKNPLHPKSFRKIQQVSIVGTASPCKQFLTPGTALFRARRCLLSNGFKIVCERNITGVNGFIVFERV